MSFFFAAWFARRSASTGPKSASRRCSIASSSQVRASFCAAATRWSMLSRPISLRSRPCFRAAARAAASPPFCTRFLPRTTSNTSTLRSARRKSATSTIRRYMATCPRLMSKPLVVHVEGKVRLDVRLADYLRRVGIFVAARIEARHIHRDTGRHLGADAAA